MAEVFRMLAAQRECRVEEGHLMADHVHMMLPIPPNLSPRLCKGSIYLQSNGRRGSDAGVAIGECIAKVQIDNLPSAMAGPGQAISIVECRDPVY